VEDFSRIRLSEESAFVFLESLDVVGVVLEGVELGILEQ